MNKEIKVEQCPMCGRGCMINEVRCGKGRRFVEELNNGDITEERINVLKEEAIAHKKRHEEFKKLPQEERLMIMISKCGNKLNNNNGKHHGKGRILKVLLEKGTMTQSELQEVVDVRSGSLSEILSKMEDREFIKREKDENDKRKVNISITEKGKEFILSKNKENKDNSKDLFKAISEEEKNQLEDILLKLVKSWKGKCKHGEHIKEDKKEIRK